jgi:lipoyl(octanoyl) transferase
MKQQVLFKDLGNNQPYKKIWDLQESLLQQNVKLKMQMRDSHTLVKEELQTNYDKQTGNHLLFVEHSPVYTLGKSGDINNVLIDDDDRSKKGIEFFKINRGGDITFHGPGQLVGYPIIDLEYFKTDLGYRLQAGRSEGETGVWLDADIRGKERKICAMGIRCSRWITMHGFAFNVNTDLNYFNYIIPCGIQNKQVTSLQKELGGDVDINEVKRRVKTNFEKVFDVEVIEEELH